MPSKNLWFKLTLFPRDRNNFPDGPPCIRFQARDFDEAITIAEEKLREIEYPIISSDVQCISIVRWGEKLPPHYDAYSLETREFPPRSSS